MTEPVPEARKCISLAQIETAIVYVQFICINAVLHLLMQGVVICIISTLNACPESCLQCNMLKCYEVLMRYGKQK